MIVNRKRERIITGMFSTLKNNNALICNHCGKRCNENNILLEIDLKKKILRDRMCRECYEK